MPARGWYEWNEKELVRSNSGLQVKQPYYICAPNAEGITFAGVWAVWPGQDGSQVLSCALLSKAAAPAIVHIHDRMLVVFKPEHFDAWRTSNTLGTTIQEIITDSHINFINYPVSTRVNKA